jgi:hypothetical protein
MDQSATSALECPTAMRTARSAVLDLLLPAAAGECGELAPAPATRRAVPPDPVLRKPEDGRRTGSEPQANPAADEHIGHRRHLFQAPSQSPDAGHQIYPYLLRGVEILRPNHVWISRQYGFVPESAWILHCKEQFGLVAPGTARAQIIRARQRRLPRFTRHSGGWGCCERVGTGLQTCRCTVNC